MYYISRLSWEMQSKNDAALNWSLRVYVIILITNYKVNIICCLLLERGKKDHWIFYQNQQNWTPSCGKTFSAHLFIYLVSISFVYKLWKVLACMFYLLCNHFLFILVMQHLLDLIIYAIKLQILFYCQVWEDDEWNAKPFGTPTF